MWFWATIADFITLHILLILFVPWTDTWIPALVVIPIGIADSYGMLWVISFVAKFKGVPMLPDSRHLQSKQLPQDQDD
jgi:hypothetical protein